MQVICLGGAGFIGQHLVHRLLEDHVLPIVVDPTPFPGGKDLPIVHYEMVVEQFVYGGYWQQHAHATEVINLASPVGPVGILERWPIAARIVGASAAALSLADVLDVRLVNISTSEIYGQGGVYLETTEVHVPARHSLRLAYAVGKHAAEMDAHTSEVDVVTLRPFNVAGAGQDPAKGFAIPRMMRQKLDGKAITVYTPGTQKRAFMHVDDMVAAILDAMNYAPGPNDPRVFNVGNADNEISMYELAVLVASAADGSAADVSIVDPHIEHGAAFEEAAGMTKLPDCRLAAEHLGWVPTRGLMEIISDVMVECLATRA